MAPAKHLLLIHGRGPKPDQRALEALWLSALRVGIARDAPDRLGLFERSNIDFLYYADLLASYTPADHDAGADLEDRRLALQQLGEFTRTKDFRRRSYELLPGKSPIKELVFDTGATLGLGGLLHKHLVPELADYVTGAASWRAELNQRAAQWLAPLERANADVLIVAHCLGSVVAFQALRNLSGESVKPAGLVTMGSPLSSAFVQRQLDLPGNRDGIASAPTLGNWHNLAAEDDYLCHDKTVADDFREWVEHERFMQIIDHTMYNLTIREGRSNPHSSLGYLLHPRLIQIVTDWLAA